MALTTALSATPSPQTYLVTGSTDGIGRYTAGRLASLGHTVLIHGRSPERVRDTVDALARDAPGAAVEGFVADLSSLAEVRRLAAEVEEAHPVLDGLLNNAGTFDGDYTGRRVVTADGNEYSLAVNVLAPFLLTSLLLDAVRRSGRGRVLVTSSISMGGGGAALDDLQCEARWSGHRAYSLSKLCDAMIAIELDARYGDPPRLCFNTMDPGTVDTKMLNAGWGSGAPVRTATRSFEMLIEPRWGEQSGVCACGGDREVHDPAARRKLWDELVELTGAAYPPPP